MLRALKTQLIYHVPGKKKKQGLEFFFVSCFTCYDLQVSFMIYNGYLFTRFKLGFNGSDLYLKPFDAHKIY